MKDCSLAEEVNLIKNLGLKPRPLGRLLSLNLSARAPAWARGLKVQTNKTTKSGWGIAGL